MKKFRKILKGIWLERLELLQVLVYIITFGWFAYVVAMVYNSDGSILGKVFFTVWSLVLAFLFLIHKCHNADN